MLRAQWIRTAVVSALALSALLPGTGDAAVYSNGSNTVNFDVTLTLVANRIIAANPLSFGSSQGTNTLTVYGQIPARPMPMPDAYQSTITATVFF